MQSPRVNKQVSVTTASLLAQLSGDPDWQSCTLPRQVANLREQSSASIDVGEQRQKSFHSLQARALKANQDRRKTFVTAAVSRIGSLETTRSLLADDLERHSRIAAEQPDSARSSSIADGLKQPAHATVAKATSFDDSSRSADREEVREKEFRLLQVSLPEANHEHKRTLVAATVPRIESLESVRSRLAHDLERHSCHLAAVENMPEALLRRNVCDDLPPTPRQATDRILGPRASHEQAGSCVCDECRKHHILKKSSPKLETLESMSAQLTEDRKRHIGHLTSVQYSVDNMLQARETYDDHWNLRTIELDPNLEDSLASSVIDEMLLDVGATFDTRRAQDAKLYPQPEMLWVPKQAVQDSIDFRVEAQDSDDALWRVSIVECEPNLEDVMAFNVMQSILPGEDGSMTPDFLVNY